MLIRDKESLRFAYITLSAVKELESEKNIEDSKAMEIKTEVKKSIREYYKKQDAKQKRRYIKDYGIDGYVEEVELPAEIQTKEQAEDYFNAHERIDYRPRAYDCTGQAFTSSHFIVPLRGRLWLSHSVSFDV